MLATLLGRNGAAEEFCPSPCACVFGNAPFDFRAIAPLTSPRNCGGTKQQLLILSAAIGFLEFTREGGSERSMRAIFRRQLADYVEYHRDPNNCVMHVFGIIFLFTAAVLPLSLWRVTIFGFQTNAAAFAVIPVLIYWLLLDAALGMAILGAAIILLLVAATIVSHASITAVWTLFIVLLIVGVAAQIIGHQVFEGRKPSLVDNPPHLLLGPMFVMAKLFIAFGFRSDLAVVIEQGSPLISARGPSRQQKGQRDIRQDS